MDIEKYKGIIEAILLPKFHDSLSNLNEWLIEKL